MSPLEHRINLCSKGLLCYNNEYHQLEGLSLLVIEGVVEEIIFRNEKWKL